MPLPTVGTGREDATTTPWPVPQERRTLTVLFADIVGSTALTERLDPEDVRAVQFAYFDTVAGVLRRWQGTVEKYVGDAVMALFGARTSDGLDGYRAVRAALEIQAALDRRTLPGGVTLRVRVGVATGEAVVDLAAARDGGHGMASGAVLTTAARIQEYAPAGGVVVCAATHRATAGLVDQHALAPASLTGKTLPVDVWRVTRPARHRPARHDGPLIGRRREVATALDQLTRAAREHRPRWVALTGPDGIGRSRLLAELRHRLPAVDGRAVRWAVAHCPPYPEQVFGPVAELLRDLAGLPAGDPAGAVRPRLAALVDGLVPAGQVGPTVAALAALLDAPDRSAVAGAAAVRRVLLALAAHRPVVVGVDDLDRAAPALGRFLHSLFTAATDRGLPLAVLATHRPDRTDPLPAPVDRHRVELAPLDALHTGRLLRRLLAGSGRPAGAAARLLPLVAGRPGHAAAYVEAMSRPGTGGDPLAGPAVEPALPESLRRRAAARLDRCDGVHRAVLMAAATLDVPVTAPVVAVLLDWAPERAARALRRLTDAGLLEPSTRGGLVVADPALRRCAADRLLRSVRADLIRRAASAGLAGTAARAGAVRSTGMTGRAGISGRVAPVHRAAPGRRAGVTRAVDQVHRVGPAGRVAGAHRAGSAGQGAGTHRAGAAGQWPGAGRTAAAAGVGGHLLRSLPTGDGVPDRGVRQPTALPGAVRPHERRRRSGGTEDGRPGWTAAVAGRPSALPARSGRAGRRLAVVVLLPPRPAGVGAAARPTTGRRRRGEGMPPPAVPLPRAA
ncbi:adenylate/guanylate cyclase domain-containing protein [Micromonospora sp. HUAS LYJ1]|uniref:adenylate/guanylate cyclase domain-containing protein n=1 Tax=Micromonospora sp. HUAS LYJ1 TaxID=3061626 RepID=UPI0026717F5A|nr:adenylate/guanylate cyclase domain-containing protein [Micromonospora sp. HUAS LYJ1]WKU06591.1 adenylate/guanylate cyclase domain-containing protein [Micromonospora sp. HUAS LYJ1]